MAANNTYIIQLDLILKINVHQTTFKDRWVQLRDEKILTIAGRYDDDDKATFWLGGAEPLTSEGTTI